MSYTIEEGIPIPKARGKVSVLSEGPRTAWTRVLGALEVGQSVMTGDFKEYRAAMQFAVREKPKKFAFRKMSDGWRVWRTE